MKLRLLPLALPILLASSAASQTAITLAPIADYHIHLVSPATAPMSEEPLLPSVELPPQLARLLRERERVWNNQKGLAALYTEESILLNTQNPDLPGWVRGRAEVSAAMAERFSRAYTIMPVEYGLDGSNAHIAGYFTRPNGSATRYFGSVLLSLHKGRDAAWQIAAEAPVFPGPRVRDPITAEQAIKQLDDAGIQRGVVLSVAYWYGSPYGRPVENEYAKVQAENDWTAAEVGRFPNRLVAFCSFNPLKDYALRELDRCSKNPVFKGIKLHFGNSGVDILKDSTHVTKLRQVFRAANDHHLAIVAHLWNDPPYEEKGKEYAEIFLNRILPEAPDVTVQIAHMAGGGRSTDSALGVFADAIAAGDPRTRNVYFDVATLTAGQSPAGLQKDAARMRQIGLSRILYGTDMTPPSPAPRESWATFRVMMPLTDEEIRTIAGNVAPYLR